MEFSTFLAFVCLFALLIYARRIESRRRQDARELSDYIAGLTSRIHALEQQAKQQSTSAPVPAAAMAKPAVTSPVPPAPKISEPTLAQPPAQPPKPAVPAVPLIAAPAAPKAPTVGPVTPPAHPPQPVQPLVAAAAAASAVPPNAQKPLA